MTDRPLILYHADREAKYTAGPRLPAKEQSSLFRDHACSGCRDGERPCREGHPHRCG